MFKYTLSKKKYSKQIINKIEACISADLKLEIMPKSSSEYAVELTIRKKWNITNSFILCEIFIKTIDIEKFEVIIIIIGNNNLNDKKDYLYPIKELLENLEKELLENLEKELLDEL